MCANGVIITSLTSAIMMLKYGYYSISQS